ncbi:hypothetical protein [Rhodococcus opacus]|uniref:hypothetical protein n=1 Tax=Rhodococcus opacus TaxID=37919 RepID=UPI002948CA92|nr:hypothetical protein [Rhodococcus opacus]MDV6245287.1 hypothetical protein [Rhodococcus opacus]
MWTNPDSNELERYQELPEPLKLTRYLRLLKPDPTGWVSILRLGEPSNPHSTLTCVLVNSTDVPKILSHPDWSVDDLGSSWNSTSRNPIFEEGLSAIRNGYTMHFFAQARHHQGFVQRTIELTPSFLWWLRLIQADDGHWIRIDDAGRRHDVIQTSRFEDGGYDVQVDAVYLRRYLAARGMSLIVQHRHTVWTDLDNVDRIDLNLRSNTAIIDYCATPTNGSTKHNFFADILGKHAILPFDRVGEGPDDTLRPEKFQEFIIGTDPSTGEVIRWTCDVPYIEHSKPGEPNYLTPVYFDTDVLTRYREDTTTYVLSRTRLWCLDLWGLDLDINDEGLVQLWLGDMKHQLPEPEREHWLVHNVVPRGGVTEIRYRRDVLNQWNVDDQRPDVGNLRRARTKLNAAVVAEHGVELYRRLGKHDQQEFDGLSLCTNSSASQRDLSIVVLTKGVVDALDVKVLRKLADADKSEASLNCLQAWIGSLGGDTDELCGPLRLLQTMRSTGSAHLKGSRYDAAIASEGWGSLSPDKQFQQLVQRVTTALDEITKLISRSSSPTPSEGDNA